VSLTSPAWKAVFANSRSRLALEVVKTADAADPPADITAFKPGQPQPGELLLRLAIDLSIRLATGLAGSRGNVGVAANGQTDFDIRRNGASFATMRFAATADTAIFIGFAETVLEPDDGLKVDSPGTPDATLADVGFTLVGTLVI